MKRHLKIRLENFFKAIGFKHIARKSNEGFTIIELMIVIAIIALIGGAVATNVMKQFDKAKVDTTKNQMRAIGTILNEFRRECGFYPTSDQGLDALIAKPTVGRECKNYDPEGYIENKKLPKDGFNNPFDYESDGNKYKITCLGKDGVAGGEGLDADFTSEDL
jgi:general secretion pathway protein G